MQGSVFKNLTPKQKKIALVVGAAAVLALIALLSRNKAEAPVEETDNQQQRELEAREAFGVPVAAGATDPTAFLGSQSEDFTDALGSVGSSLSAFGGSVDALGQEFDQFRSDSMTAAQESAERQGAFAGQLETQNRQLGGVQKMLAAQRAREKKRAQAQKKAAATRKRKAAARKQKKAAARKQNRKRK